MTQTHHTASALNATPPENSSAAADRENQPSHSLSAVDALVEDHDSRPPRRSRLATLRALPWRGKWPYFRDQLLLKTVAGLAAIGIAVFLAVHIFAPAAKPQLYVAVIDGALSSQSAATLQSQTARALNLPEGRNGGVMVDASFNFSEGDLSKLQTLLSSGEVDAIIAPPKDFAKLAGYGYFTALHTSLTASQRAESSSDWVRLRGYDDSESTDAFYDGSGKGPTQAYGIRLTHAQGWDSLHPARADAVIGFVQGSKNLGTSQALFDYLYQGRHS